MNDRTFSAGCALAYGLWLSVVVLMGAATVSGHRMLGLWGLATSAAAATATVRCFFVKQARTFHDAYRLGEEAEKHQVSRLR